jgi:hypothetical protein
MLEAIFDTIERMKLLIFSMLGLLLFNAFSLADDTDDDAKQPCSEHHHHQAGNVSSQELPMTAEDGGGCSLTIGPANPEKIYRTYTFKSDGLIQIEDVYGNNPKNDNESTGTTVFYVFPRSGRPTASLLNVIDPATHNRINEMQVKLSSGDAIIYSSGQQRTPTTAPVLPLMINGEGGIDVTEDPVISAKNNGGIKIRPNAGSTSIVLDCGYKHGNKPSVLNPLGSCTFMDSGNHSCSVSNSVLFKRDKYGAELAYKRDRDLFAYLKLHCPHDFQVPSPLAPTGYGGVGGSGAHGSAGGFNSP